ncbi:MAG TPA: ribulose-phosphate 3-epimerase [Bacilli bacterium]|jgi:ribulose-phosphate 3-epimerase|nr:ribulose-phosphate 3-epimerase [Bacilli bacterium]
MKVSVSILKSNRSNEETLKKINLTNADYIHLDVMDNTFVDNASLTNEEIIKLFKDTIQPMDIHLMVNHPKSYVDALKNLNVNDFIFPVEILGDKKELINYIHELGFKVGLSINPDTKVSIIRPYLEYVDIVLIMGVNPGFGGQPLIPSTTMKIHELNYLRSINDYNYIMSFDGGVNSSTINLLKGLDMVVSGSYVCLGEDYQENINKLR